MRDLPPGIWKKLWIVPPVILGILVLMFMKSGKMPPQKTETAETARSARFITVQKTELIPQAEGYGTVQPSQVWSAVAQVSGRIIETHPRLRDGEILPQGTLLFKIDPVDYELNLAKAEAELAELEVQEKNTGASLKIEQRNLEIARREVARISKLTKKGTASRSDLDEAERAELNSQSAVQNLQNTLALIPTSRRVLQAQLAQAQRDLDNTQILAPFNLRIAGLQIETQQFVSKGEKLFEGDAVDQVEIVSQFPMSSLRNLFIGRQLQVADMLRQDINLAEFIKFKPTVVLDMGNHSAEWSARFIRFTDKIDSQTRTIGLVVAVDKPFDKVIPGYRPPLSKGMFVKVLLKGQPKPDQLVIPRSSIRENRVYLVDQQQRLQSTAVEVLFHQGDVSVISNGLDNGNHLVVSDLVPAINGMLLNPQLDQSLQSELYKDAQTQ